MKSFTQSIIFLAAFLVFSSCEKEQIRSDYESNFNSRFKTTVNQVVALSDNSAKIMVQVKNISDQRCTQHDNCDTPGQAVVRFEVVDLNHAKAEALLYLGTSNGELKKTDSVIIPLKGRNYIAYLHNVNPHPSQKSNEVQTAELSMRHK